MSEVTRPIRVTQLPKAANAAGAEVLVIQNGDVKMMKTSTWQAALKGDKGDPGEATPEVQAVQAKLAELNAIFQRLSELIELHGHRDEIDELLSIKQALVDLADRLLAIDDLHARQELLDRVHASIAAVDIAADPVNLAAILAAPDEADRAEAANTAAQTALSEAVYPKLLRDPLKPLIGSESQALVLDGASGHSASIDLLKGSTAAFYNAGDFTDLLNLTAGTFERRGKDGLWAAGDGNVVHHDEDGNPLGLLLEQTRTNLLTHTSSFSPLAWTPNGAVLESDAYSGPLGANTATKLTSASTGGTGYTQLYQAVTPLANTEYQASILAKADQTDWIYFRTFGFDQLGSHWGAYFNVRTGVVGTLGNPSVKATIEREKDGWWRCIVSQPIGADNSGHLAINLVPGDAAGIFNHPLDGSMSVFISGAQMEAGSTATSPIVNDTSSVVTRPNFDVTIDTTAHPFPWSETEGTILWDVEFLDNAICALWMTGSLQIHRSTSGQVIIYAGGPNGFGPAGTAYAGSHRIALSWKDGQISCTVDGVTRTELVASVPLSFPNSIDLNSRYGVRGNKILKTLSHFPRWMDDDEREAWTNGGDIA